MIKKNFLLYGTFFGLIGLIIFLYYPATQTYKGDPTEKQNGESTNLVSQLNENDLKVMDRVYADLTSRLGEINVSGVEIVDFQKLNFPDASLDCAEPGMSYSQVITPGYKILIKYENETYDFRLDERDVIKICNSGLEK